MANDKRAVYSSRIIKASALLSDTKTLLAAWDSDDDVRRNFETVRQQNILGKTSRKRLGDVLQIFRQRYFDDQEVGEVLVSLTKRQAPAQWIDPLLYFFSAQSDRTLRDIVTEVLYPRKQAGYIDIPVVVIQNALREWVVTGKTTFEWNSETIERVAQGVVATLRDFGVLEGKVNKQINPIYLPLESFALIAFWLMQKLKAGKMVLHSEDWRLFFLDVAGVERYFIEAHQEGWLSYYSSGSVVRLEFAASGMKEYADGFLKSTH
jgi:hypothetical protein